MIHSELNRQVFDMSTVQEIQQAVSRLSREDLTHFREWFERYDAEIWDQQFEKDAQSGKLDRFAEQALEDFRAGKYKEL